MSTYGAAQARWNRRYAEGGFEPFPDDPSGWLAAHDDLLRPLAPGRALDVACGNGRNALHLARLGFEVDALDVSDYAIERLRTAAGERELPIGARVADLEREPLRVAGYSVVACFNYLQRELFPALEAALEPSGLLVYETFVAPQTSMNPAYVLEPGELRTAFPALTVLDYREEDGVAGLVARSATNSS